MSGSSGSGSSGGEAAPPPPSPADVAAAGSAVEAFALLLSALGVSAAEAPSAVEAFFGGAARGAAFLASGAAGLGVEPAFWRG